jgi:hypothetical protein
MVVQYGVQQCTLIQRLQQAELHVLHQVLQQTLQPVHKQDSRTQLLGLQLKDATSVLCL